MQKELYPHNAIAYDKLVTFLKTNNKGCIIQPTGTGKSYIIDKFVSDNLENTFIIITSQSFIIDQFRMILPNRSNIHFFTYHSLVSSEYKTITELKPNYIILDEFHRAGALKWHISLINLLKINKTAKIIGFSATPIRTDFLDKDKYIKKNMASVLFNDKIIHELSLKESMDLGILPAPKYIKTLYSVTHISNTIKNKLNKSYTTDKNLIISSLDQNVIDWEKSSGVDIILKKHITDERNFVVFCRSVSHIKESIELIKNWFIKAFFLPTNVLNIKIVHSQLPNSHEILSNFQNEILTDNKSFNFLFSVNQLNEGVHLKNIQGVIFLRPTTSHIIYFQQLGRCLSSQSSRPIVLDLVNNFTSTSPLKSLFEDKQKKSFSKTEEESIRNKNKTYLHSFDIIDEVTHYKDIFDNIEAKLDNWNLMFDSIKHKIIENSSLTQQEYSWLHYQRYLYKNNKIKNIENRKLLETISYIISDPSKNNLDNIISLYHTGEYDKSSITKLLSYYRKKNLISPLDKNTISQLNELAQLIGRNNFEFTERDTWDDKYLSIKINGLSNKSSNVWIIKQKMHLLQNKLSKEKAELLDQLNSIIGFNWRLGKDDLTNWESLLNQIKNKLQNNILLNKEESQWIITHRSKLKSGNLTNVTKINLLNTLNPYFPNNDWTSKQSRKTDLDIYIKNMYKNKPNKAQIKNILRHYNSIQENHPLNKNTIDKLNEIAKYIGKFSWNTTIPTNWFASYERFCNSLNSNDNCNKSNKWLMIQRMKFNKMELSNEQIHLLDKLNPHLGYDWKSPQR